jgi:biopolymer transport protein ExbD
MQFTRQSHIASCDPDMTPMIDVTFQLIIFFLLTLNFSIDQQNEMIKLPQSELAKPPQGADALPVTLQLTRTGTVFVGGDEVTVKEIRPLLLREKEAITQERRRDVRDATVVIRADQDARAGLVQELIKACQENGFEKFALRAKQELKEEPQTATQ